MESGSATQGAPPGASVAGVDVSQAWLSGGQASVPGRLEDTGLL